MRAALAAAGLQPAELAGQVAVVTGAARGIGRAAARALAGLGARVAVVDLEDEGEECARLIRQMGGQAGFFPADVADEAAVDRLAGQVAAKLGPASAVINNAVLCPVAPVGAMSPALWDRVMAVNLRGAFLVTRAFLPAMQAAGRGTLVNMVSTDTMPGLSAYIASKQGLVGFTQSLAAELGEGAIHAVALAPGMVETPGLLGAAEGLAPMLGMSVAEFRRISLHPGYDGLMPVEHAGVAVAYLVARVAPEYHGQVVTGYELLERAGLLATPAGGTPGLATAGPTPGAGPAPGRAEGPGAQPESDQGLPHCERLIALLAETAADFERLPLFVRPLARSGFKAKAGKSIEDWRREAEALRGRIAAGEPIDAARLRADLERLIGYVRGVPAETARFTRDPQVLAQVRRRMDGYEADLLALIVALQGA